MELKTIADSEALGRAIGSVIRAGDVVALFGELGAGKTTISRAILEATGFQSEVASPTFPIVIAYDPPDVRIPVWHVDLYRIEDEGELEELALDDARMDAALLIEWPEHMGRYLWEDSLRLHLAVQPDGSRSLTAQVPEAWESRWPPQ